MDLEEHINKRFPFIDILLKNEFEEEELAKYPNGLFEIQICSYNDNEWQKSVIFSKQVSKTLPPIKKVLDRIKQSLKTCDLEV